MPRESLASKRERAAAIEARMFDHYGGGECSLDYLTPFQLTVAVVLSAQCTDAAVNKVTPELFASAVTQSVAGMDGAQPEALEKLGRALAEFAQATMDYAKEQQDARQ